MAKRIEKYSKPWWIGYLVINLLLVFSYGFICNISRGIIGGFIVFVGGAVAVILAIAGLVMLFMGNWVFMGLCWVGAALLAFLIITSYDWVTYVAIILLMLYILFRYDKKTLAFNPASGTKLGVAIRVTGLAYPGVIALALFLSLFALNKDAADYSWVTSLNNVRLLLFIIGDGCWIAHTIMMYYCAVKAWRKGEECSPS